MEEIRSPGLSRKQLVLAGAEAGREAPCLCGRYGHVLSEQRGRPPRKIPGKHKGSLLCRCRQIRGQEAALLGSKQRRTLPAFQRAHNKKYTGGRGYISVGLLSETTN